MLVFSIPMVKPSNHHNNSTIVINSISYYTPILLLSIILGLRYGVGVDYFSYEQMYESQKWSSIYDGNIEYIFSTIYFICFHLGTPYHVVQILLNLIFFFFIYKTFEKRRLIFPWVIIFIFFTGFLFQYLNIQRQAIAFSILLYSLQFIEKRHLLNFLLCIVFASGFHYSALLFLPIYYIWPSINIFKSLRLQLSLWLISFVFSEFLTELIANISLSLLENTAYGKYGASVLTWEMERGSGTGIIVKGISDLIVIMYSKKLFTFFEKDNFFKISYFVFFVGFILANIFQYNMLLSRISFLFISFRIITLSFLFCYLARKRNLMNSCIAIFLLALYSAYFFGMIYIGNNDCSPFEFIS